MAATLPIANGAVDAILPVIHAIPAAALPVAPAVVGLSFDRLTIVGHNRCVITPHELGVEALHAHEIQHQAMGAGGMGYSEFAPYKELVVQLTEV